MKAISPARFCLLSLLSLTCLFTITSCGKKGVSEKMLNDLRKPYLNFISMVFNHMDTEYYKPVSRKVYEKFIAEYTKTHLSDVETLTDGTGWLAHLGSGLLVQKIKDPEDTFTNFVPPKQAEKYAQKVYGYDHSLGISGTKSGDVFLITDIEARSDAYTQGIRPGNAIMAINDKGVAELPQEEIETLLHPPLDTEISLVIAIIEEKILKTYTLTCKEFFTETVENIPTGIPGISYFKINKFNKETAKDLKKYILEQGPGNIDFMALDITGNPGGPPLAVVEIASIFLNPGDKLVYYLKKNQPEFGMVTPPSDLQYKGRLVIVIDEKSGSASEILAGSFKAHRRAIIMGKSSTAGSANLKTSIRFDDGSMLAMLTGQAFIFDGTPMGKTGISPDFLIPGNVTDVKPFVLRQIMLSRENDAS